MKEYSYKKSWDKNGQLTKNYTWKKVKTLTEDKRLKEEIIIAPCEL